MICEHCNCYVCYCDVKPSQEKSLEGWLVDYVRKRGGKAYKLVEKDEPDFPDRTIFIDGKVGVLELKRGDDKGKLSPGQVRKIRELNNLNVYVGTAKTPQECIAFINGLVKE